MSEHLISIKLTPEQSNHIETVTGKRPTELFLETTSRDVKIADLPAGTKIVLNIAGGNGADW